MVVSARGLYAVAAAALTVLAAWTALLVVIAGRSTAVDGGRASQRAPAPLPPSSSVKQPQASTASLLGREFDRLANRFTSPLLAMRWQLAALRPGVARLGELPVALRTGVARTTAPFAGLPNELARLDSRAARFDAAPAQLARIARAAGRFRSMQSSLRDVSRELGRLEGVASDATEMRDLTAAVNGQVGGTRSSIARTNDQLGALEQIRSQLGSANGHLDALSTLVDQLALVNERLRALERSVAPLSSIGDRLGTIAGTLDETAASTESLEDLAVVNCVLVVQQTDPGPPRPYTPPEPCERRGFPRRP